MYCGTCVFKTSWRASDLHRAARAAVHVAQTAKAAVIAAYQIDWTLE